MSGRLAALPAVAALLAGMASPVAALHPYGPCRAPPPPRPPPGLAGGGSAGGGGQRAAVGDGGATYFPTVKLAAEELLAGQLVPAVSDGTAPRSFAARAACTPLLRLAVTFAWRGAHQGYPYASDTPPVQQLPEYEL